MEKKKIKERLKDKVYTTTKKEVRNFVRVGEEENDGGFEDERGNALIEIFKKKPKQK